MPTPLFSEEELVPEYLHSTRRRDDRDLPSIEICFQDVWLDCVKATGDVGLSSIPLSFFSEGGSRCV